jgi:hypothetical protein
LVSNSDGQSNALSWQWLRNIPTTPFPVHPFGVPALIGDAVRGRFELVLAEAMDRLSRDQEDMPAPTSA